jgi:hypothetical protein
MEYRNTGVMERKNKNRGYQRLQVWQDAVTLYLETCRSFKSLPFEMKRVAGQAIASADSDNFEILDSQSFKLENGLLRLIESLERKRDTGTWPETLIINESNSIYTS